MRDVKLFGGERLRVLTCAIFAASVQERRQPAVPKIRAWEAQKDELEQARRWAS